MTGSVRSGRGPAGISDRTIVLCGLGFLLLCFLYRPFVADDAYIVGRYALNAADGFGLVYNVGEYVSALTSPLHALLETGFAILGLDPVVSYRLLAPFLVLAGWFFAVKQTGLTGVPFVIFTIVGLFSPFLVLWTVGGLESGLLSCLVSLFIARLVLIKQTGAARDVDLIWLGLLAGLMFLTRYDTAIVTAPVLFAILVVSWRRTGLWVGAAICAALISGWLLFSYVYYGDIFPTSYYLKLVERARPPIDSISALLNFLLVSGVFVFPFVSRFGVQAERPAITKAIRRGGAVSAILFLVYASKASGEHMMFGYRLFVPYLTGMALVATLALPKAHKGFAAILAVGQAGMIAVVLFLGVNPAPLTRLPVLEWAYAEYESITPATYGKMMDMLTEDAEVIEAHWRDTGRNDRPSIYLRTGGTGYWLRDFYVYESLVSYRRSCQLKMQELVNSAHYLQQLGFSQSGTRVEEFGRARPDIADDAPLLFATTLDWDGPTITGYLYGPDPKPLHLGARLSSECDARCPFSICATS